MSSLSAGAHDAASPTVAPPGPAPGAPASSPRNGHAGADLPGLGAPLRPLVDGVARIHTSVHRKLLVGFLIGAILLLAMGVLSLTVIGRMSQEMDQLTRLEEKVDLSHRMEYLVTLQSHLRAMALLTRDDRYNDQIMAAKRTFADYANRVEALSPPAQRDFFQSVRDTDQRYAAAGERVLALYQAGDLDQAMQLHLTQEHPISHELESAMERLQVEAG